MPKKRNRPGTRKLEQRLFILCEGAKDKSESAYFKSLIRHHCFLGKKIEVRLIDTKKNTGKELVKEAKNAKELPIDKAWIVYDKDGYTKHAETFDMAKANGIKIAFSSISFEYWILLHFEYTNRPFEKSEDIIHHLKKQNYIDYRKGSRCVFTQTKEHLDTAKSNARRIREYQKKSNLSGVGIFHYNPYTNIDKLIDEIEELKEKDR